MSKFKIGDVVKILPFSLEGNKRCEYYAEEMLPCIGRYGVVMGVWGSGPKHYVATLDAYGNRINDEASDWYFFSSDLKIIARA